MHYKKWYPETYPKRGPLVHFEGEVGGPAKVKNLNWISGHLPLQQTRIFNDNIHGGLINS